MLVYSSTVVIEELIERRETNSSFESSSRSFGLRIKDVLVASASQPIGKLTDDFSHHFGGTTNDSREDVIWCFVRGINH